MFFKSLLFIISPHSILSSTNYTTSSLSVSPPKFIGFFWQKMSVYTMRLFRISGQWVISTKCILFLCSKCHVIWIAASTIIANYVIDNKTSFPSGDWFYKPRINESVNRFCFSSKIKNSISSIFNFRTSPVPTFCIFIKRNFCKNSSQLIGSKINFEIFNHNKIIPLAGLI